MSDLTPTELMAPPSVEEIGTKLIAYLRAIPGFPITDFESGGEMRTIIELEKMADAELLLNALPAMVGAVAPGFSSGDFLTLVAAQLYSLVRVGATIAVQNMKLTSTAAVAYTIAAGGIWFIGPTGNRWSAKTGGTLSAGGTLTIQIAAEGPGSRYNDPAGTIHTVLPQLPGVTASNDAADFTPVVPGILGSGTVTPSRTSGLTPPSQASFIIRIDSSGQVGAGAWSYSVDGGKTYRSVGVIGTTALLLAGGGASGTTVTFANGAGTPSFVAGDLYSFSTPGTSFVTVGRDQEADTALVVRCAARWPDISKPPEQSRWLKWAKAASAEVTRVRTEEDAVYLGRLYITLAGIAGPVTGGAVAAVQAYIDPRAPIGRIIVVQNSVAQPVAATGTVRVTAASLANVQAAAQAAWTATLFRTDIGGTVRVEDLVKAVMDAGALDFLSPAITGGSPNLTLTPGMVAVLPTATPLLSSQLTWQVS